MARYIDADKLKEVFSTDTQHLSTFDPDLYDLIVLDIEEAPTADVVEIPCRCERCKYTEIFTCPITGTETLFCIYGTQPVAVEATHYCGYGERKQKNDF